MHVVKALESVATGENDRPLVDCVIADCGQLDPSQLDQGDKYFDFPG